MTQESPFSRISSKSCRLLYNPKILQAASASILSEELLQQAQSIQSVTTGGRGQAWFIEMAGFSAVLRAYQRGGLVSRFNKQTYLGLSEEKSRAFKELRLLQWMSQRNLPVPHPIAAAVCRWPISIMPMYRARILVETIPNTQTLDKLLTSNDPGESVWQSIGMCIRRFHDEGIYHADLNANNILLNEKHEVFLIDFDKSEHRVKHKKSDTWKANNLQRLERSFLKQKALHEHYHFSQQDWKTLMSAYKID